MYYIAKRNFVKLLDSLKNDYFVYLPQEKEGSLFWSRYSPGENVSLGAVRTSEPLKAFFLKARENVACGWDPSQKPKTQKPFCLIGAKACDLKAFQVQDFVFQNHDYPDPFYNRLRRDNLIISTDCTGCLDTCFCVNMGIKPYPESDFDLNLSEVRDGFVVDVASDKGQNLVDKNHLLFEKEKKELVNQRDKQRQETINLVTKNINDNDIPHEDEFDAIIEKNYESDIWKKYAQDCVECGACNTICPTCHCFLLYDQKNEENLKRLRVWDSCMVKDFARVAGGANPREKLWMRLRNRFEKKFDFFPKTARIYACTGCGRCIRGCPAKIDIRKVLKELVGK